MSDEIEKLKMHSPDLTQDNIAKIRVLFPGCVTEAAGEDGKLRLAVDFDQLRQELSDSIVEWNRGSFTLAASLDFGTEKQARLPGQPRYDWAAGAVWAGWQLHRRWTVGLRPEFYHDPDGNHIELIQLVPENWAQLMKANQGGQST